MSGTPAAQIPPAAIFTIESPSLLGSYFASMLYGVTVLQALQYFDKYGRKDKLYIQILVILTWVLDTFNIAMVIYSEWILVLRGPQDPGILLIVTWPGMGALSSTPIISCIIQGFYCYRLYILNGRKWLFPAFTLLLAVASLVLMLWYFVQIYVKGALAFIPAVTWASTASLSMGLATDVIIAVGMTIFLARGRTGLRKTESIIRKLTIYTISTGTAATIIALVTVILGLKFPSSYINTISYYPLSKIYVNSFLAFLNVRDELRNGRSGQNSTTKGVYMSTTTAFTSDSGTRDRRDKIELRGIESTVQFSENPDATDTVTKKPEMISKDQPFTSV